MGRGTPVIVWNPAPELVSGVSWPGATPGPDVTVMDNS